MTSLSSHLSHNAGGVFAVIDAWSALDYKLTELATRMSAHHERVSNWYRLIYERPNPPGCRVSVRLTLRPRIRFNLDAGLPFRLQNISATAARGCPGAATAGFTVDIDAFW